jgi:hypothetical protein
VEHDDVIDAVEELGPEDLLELAHDAALHVVVRDAGLVVGTAKPSGVLRAISEARCSRS